MVSGWDPLLQLRGIKKTYLMGKVPVEALRDIDLAVDPGELIAVMGPSGSGKTTLLNIIGLLDTASIGSFKLNCEEVGNLSDRKRSELRNKYYGFIFQVYNLLPRLTALENVAVPLVYAGVKKKERLSRAAAALEAVNLTSRAKHHPNELSGGEQQRVAIARALVNNPSVLLADEPTGNLDSVSGAAIIELLLKIHQEKKLTVIIVTHDGNIASRAERIVRLKDGMITPNGLEG
jgi:putative ABC transport system ATP-binding protein